MTKVIYTYPALDDLTELHEAIARDAPVAAARLAQELFDRCDDLSFMPLRYARLAGFESDIRHFTHKNRMVIFQVKEDIVRILRVVYARRDIPNIDLNPRRDRP